MLLVLFLDVLSNTSQNVEGLSDSQNQLFRLKFCWYIQCIEIIRRFIYTITQQIKVPLLSKSISKHKMPEQC